MLKKITVFTVLAIGILFAVLTANTKDVTLTLTGDILLDRGVEAYLVREGTGYPYEKVKHILKKSDIVFGNLECPPTDRGIPVLKSRNLIFRADPSNAEALASAGFNVLNLANNHSMDYGHEGIWDTIKALEDAGIRTVGAGQNSDKARCPLYIKTKDLEIGFLGYSAFPREGYFYFPDRPDIAYIDASAISNEIKSADINCDILVVSFHWGKEFDFYPLKQQKQLARLAVDSGADIVAGHHPHVLQGIEEYGGRYIFYSLGNFVFDRQIPSGTDETVIVSLKINKKGIKKMELIPVRITNCQPEPVSSEDARHILKRLQLYSPQLLKDIVIDAVFNCFTPHKNHR